MSKLRIMLFQGSPRRKDNCPDQWSKTHLLAQHMIDYAPDDVEIDFCDLSVSPETVIQPCKGCVSTSIFHCHYRCDCYAPDAIDPRLKDYMHDGNIYERLELCDGFIIITPIHWYSTTSQIKLMFDRLVCINNTITTQQSGDLGIGKNAEKSIPAEQSGEYHHLLKNHYQGKFAGFLIHGDAGGADYKEIATKKRRYLPTFPPSYTEYMKEDYSGGWIDNPRNSIMNLVWQCRYSGIFVPDDLVVGITATKGISYSEAMEKAVDNLEDFYQEGLDLLLRLRSYLLP